jgi:hypothetical protein
MTEGVRTDGSVPCPGSIEQVMHPDYHVSSVHRGVVYWSEDLVANSNIHAADCLYHINLALGHWYLVEARTIRAIYAYRSSDVGVDLQDVELWLLHHGRYGPIHGCSHRIGYGKIYSLVNLAPCGDRERLGDFDGLLDRFKYKLDDGGRERSLKVRCALSCSE